MKREPEPTEIIGVVGDVKQLSLDEEQRPTVYWPHPELTSNFMTLVVRAKGDPLSGRAGAQGDSVVGRRPAGGGHAHDGAVARRVGRARAL